MAERCFQKEVADICHSRITAVTPPSPNYRFSVVLAVPV